MTATTQGSVELWRHAARSVLPSVSICVTTVMNRPAVVPLYNPPKRDHLVPPRPRVFAHTIRKSTSLACRTNRPERGAGCQFRNAAGIDAGYIRRCSSVHHHAAHGCGHRGEHSPVARSCAWILDADDPQRAHVGLRLLELGLLRSNPPRANACTPAWGHAADTACCSHHDGAGDVAASHYEGRVLGRQPAGIRADRLLVGISLFSVHVCVAGS